MGLKEGVNVTVNMIIHGYKTSVQTSVKALGLTLA
jgi:hypothetical protein